MIDERYDLIMRRYVVRKLSRVRDWNAKETGRGRGRPLVIGGPGVTPQNLRSEES